MYKALLILIVVVFGSCQNRPSSEITTYSYELIGNDSTYYIRVNIEKGDTVSGATAHGIVIRYDSTFFNYNDSLIQFDKNQIIPKAIGSTKVIIRFPNDEIDSFTVNIYRSNGRLIVGKLAPA